MRFCYTLLYTCAMIVALPYFLIAGLFRGKYIRSAKQRFGFIPVSSSRPSIWVHAVSVGEFLAAKPLLKRLREEYPQTPLFVSTTTITGQQLASNFLSRSTFYFPFDWNSCIRRVFARLKPQLILVLETELWPNFLWEAHGQKIPVLLVNGRLSERSISRYRLLRSWLPRFDECLMQSEEDVRRMVSLAVQPQKVRLMGNLKFDFAPSRLSPDLRGLLSEWKGTDHLWIAGSTMPGEEEFLLKIFADLPADWKFLIAPRHPERFSEVKNLLKRSRLPFVCRSEEGAAPFSGQHSVLILDSIGELAACYEMADLVFIGGTIGNYGGHNPIEPAAFGKAIVSGKHYSNFHSIFKEFHGREAILISRDLQSDLPRLAADTALRLRMGNEAQRIVSENAGATDSVLQIMRHYLDDRNVLDPVQKLPV